MSKSNSFFFILLFFLSLNTNNIIAQQAISLKSPEAIFQQALNLYNQNQYQIAKELFESIDTKELNNNLRILSKYYTLIIELKLNKPHSDEKLDKFLVENPVFTKKIEANLLLAHNNSTHDEYEKAIQRYQKIDEYLVPEDKLLEYYFDFGYALFKSGKYSLAKIQLTKVVGTNNQYYDESIYYLAVIAYWTGNLQEALENFNAILNKKGYNEKISFYVANIYFKQKKHKKALETSLKIIDKKTAKEPETKKKKKKKRRRKSKKSSQKFDGFELKDIQIIIGESYFNLEKYSDALPYLIDIKLKNKLQQNVLFYQIGISYFFEKDYKNAIKFLKKYEKTNDIFTQHTYYYLGYSYLKSNKKNIAINNLKMASNMEFDKEIQEDAHYVYAKLSYELGDVFNTEMESLSTFLKLYPKSPNVDEIKRLQLSYLLTTQKYEKAIKTIEKIENPSFSIKKALQRLLYQKAVGEYNLNKKDQAYDLFKKVTNLNINSKYNDEALYWLGEINYRKRKYKESIENYSYFLSSQTAYTSSLNEYAQYNIAINYLKLKDYKRASQTFRHYVVDAKNIKLKTDAMVKQADAQFLMKDYISAAATYIKIADQNLSKGDYALYQAAICYSLLKLEDKQNKTLKRLIIQYIKSRIRDKVIFELAENLSIGQKWGESIEYYRLLLEVYPKSKYRERAHLQLGLAYYNNLNDIKALETLKQVIAKSKDKAIVNQAQMLAKKIYMDGNNIKEFIEWAKKENVNISIHQLDSTLYEKIEKNFKKNDCIKTLEGISQYLDKFPKGARVKKVVQYAIRCSGRKEDTQGILRYSLLLDSISQPDYDEENIAEIVRIYLEKKDLSKAKKYLIRIAKKSKDDDLLKVARLNLLNIYQNEKDTVNAISIAKNISENYSSPENIVDKANWLLSQNALTQKNQKEAITYFKKLEKSKNSAYKAEAFYYKSLFLHVQSEYEKSNETVFYIAQNISNQTYWGAKALVIMAKNYLYLDDLYQAEFTIKNILSTFSYKDVMKDAQKVQKEIEMSKIESNKQKKIDSLEIDKIKIYETDEINK